MYTPINTIVYNAAYAGALSGMGTAGRNIVLQTPAAYSNLSAVVGAFAQAFDQAWNSSAQVDRLQYDAIEQESQGYWTDRAPQPNDEVDSVGRHSTSRWLIPGTYTKDCNALIAVVQAAEVYYAGQGITPPPYGGGGAGYTTVQVVNDNYAVPVGTNNVLVGFTGLTANRILTLPATPFDGQSVAFKDEDGSLSTRTVTVSGGIIDGQASVVLDIAHGFGPYAGVTFVYSAAAMQWFQAESFVVPAIPVVGVFTADSGFVGSDPTYTDLVTVNVTIKPGQTKAIVQGSAGGIAQPSAGSATPRLRCLVDGVITPGLGGFGPQWVGEGTSSGVQCNFTGVVSGLTPGVHVFKLQASYAGSTPWSISAASDPNNEFANLVVIPINR